MSIAVIRWHSLRISPQTVWSFIELVEASGRIGVGEATLIDREAAMVEVLDRCGAAVIGRTPSEVNLDPARAQASGLPQFAVVSALDQAVQDLVAQARGVSVAESMGGRRRDRVPTYANINRGIAERTPEGFAANARAALRDGFTAIKIAPFDRVELFGDERKTVDYALIGAGLARIGAVRDAIGPDVDLMVDCHWRLTRTVAETVIRATESLRLHWLECPVPETPEMLDTLCALRSIANSRGVLLAGCEEMSLVAGFMPFLEVGAYDVMMPDAKYVGGMRQMLEVADMLASYGVAFSPHNPSGPVCHAASLQICAASEHLQRLEMQYNETPLFNLIVRPAVAKAVNGAIEVSRMPGLGVALDPTQVEALREAVAGQSAVSFDVKRVYGAG